MTTRELRQFLFEIRNQEMTLSELRYLLFKVEEQDEKLTAGMVRKLEAELKQEQ